MSNQVNDAELAVLEYGQIDLQVKSQQVVNHRGHSRFRRPSLPSRALQELLGDALTEVQHCKELRCIDNRTAVVLRDQANCAAAHADYVYKDLTQSSTQVC